MLRKAALQLEIKTSINTWSAMSSNDKNSWQSIATSKRASLDALIPREWLLDAVFLPKAHVGSVMDIPGRCGILSAEELAMTEANVSVLLDKMASRTWRSSDVVRAFCKRAAIAQQLTNCLTEIMFDEALARAEALDLHLQRSGKPVGPLHGLPVSLKDQFAVKGFDSTIGCTAFVGNPAMENAVVVDLLLQAGAIPFVKTNVPQTSMWGETYNFIFGRALNPHNLALTPGGSSGGEAALIAFRGSPLGVGSDIGGSIRFPGALSGLYGLRPSNNRIPWRGATEALAGINEVMFSSGPLTTSLDGVRRFMDAIVSQEPWRKDPRALGIPWNKAKTVPDQDRRYVFGFLADDGAVRTTPPVSRALRVTREALLAQGHKVVDMKPLHLPELVDLVYKLWASGGRQSMDAIMRKTGEPRLTSMAIDAPTVLPLEEGEASGVDAYAVWQLNLRLGAIRNEWADYWNATLVDGKPVDAIIGPIAPFAGALHGQVTTVFTTAFNVLDFPGVVIPVTTVDQVLDTKEPLREFSNDVDRASWTDYSPEKLVNAPVGLQILGRRYEDEALLAASEVVDIALAAHKVSVATSRI